MKHVSWILAFVALVALAQTPLPSPITGGGGGGGTGCVPSGTAKQILTDSGSGTCTSNTPTISGSTITATLAGNSSTATALATARAINGVNFDGTAPITVTAAAGTLSGATLAAGVTASSLTSFGNSPTIITPTIASFTNATHNHSNAAGGGTFNTVNSSTCTGTPSSSTFLRGDCSWSTSAGGSFDPFDLAATWMVDNFSGNPTALLSAGWVGDLEWKSSIEGTGSLALASNDAKSDGGVVFSTGAVLGGKAYAYLRVNASEAAGFGFTNLSTVSAFHQQFRFRTPDGAATGVLYLIGLDSGAFTDGLRLQYTQGSDTAWTIKVRASGGSTNTICTASAAPAANTYYLWDWTQSGSSTVTVHLYASGTAYAASGDLFTACTATLPSNSAGYTPLVYLDNQSSNTTGRIILSSWRAQFTF